MDGGKSTRKILGCTVLLLGVTVAVPGLAQAVKPAGAQIAPSQHKVLLARSSRITKALTIFDQLIRRPVPKGLTPAQVAQWHQQTAWFSRIRLRLATYRRNLRMTINKARARFGSNMIAEMKLANRQFMLLHKTIQQESRRFQNLSNSARARHEAAMAAIRNTRA